MPLSMSKFGKPAYLTQNKKQNIYNYNNSNPRLENGKFGDRELQSNEREKKKKRKGKTKMEDRFCGAERGGEF